MCPPFLQIPWILLLAFYLPSGNSRLLKKTTNSYHFYLLSICSFNALFSISTASIISLLNQTNTPLQVSLIPYLHPSHAFPIQQQVFFLKGNLIKPHSAYSPSSFKVCWRGLSRQMHSFQSSLLPHSIHISPDLPAIGAVCYAQTTLLFQESWLSQLTSTFIILIYADVSLFFWEAFWETSLVWIKWFSIEFL